MKKVIWFFSILLLSAVLFTSAFLNVHAATGYQGYAIYRDGVLWGLEWHAGLMDSPDSSYYLPVTHHPGDGYYVMWASFEDFLDGNNFKGVYRPNTDPTSSQRDLFVAMGRRLISEEISYNLLYQVAYHLNQDLGTWVDPDEIIGMRCDGVVEYVYEWYGFRVYGNDNYWDVTRFGLWNQDHHSGTAITPKSQTNYLTLVTTNEP